MPWIFALVSAIVAALVAAAGDRMGHRAARRKLRIGKLRPRTVSTIIAVATGVLISLATYGAMFAFWANFRDALTHYNQVKADLGRAEAELKQARADTLQAQTERASVEEELKVSSSKVSALTAEVEGLNTEVAAVDRQLRDTSLSLSQTDALLKKKERLQAQLAQSLKALESQKQALESDIEAAKINVEALKARAAEADILLPKGAYLTYERLPGGDPGQTRSLLQRALNRVNIRFSQEGIAISPDTEPAASAFLESAALGSAGDKALILSVGRNLFQGEDLLIAFEARPLAVLVNAGQLVMDISISADEARISMAGLEDLSLSLRAEEAPAEQLGRVLASAYERFAEGMSGLGFLPQAPSGDWATPFDAIAARVGDIAATPRPLRIQIVSKQDADALSGLEACEIYVKSQAAAPPADVESAGEEGGDA